MLSMPIMHLLVVQLVKETLHLDWTSLSHSARCTSMFATIPYISKSMLTSNISRRQLKNRSIYICDRLLNINFVFVVSNGLFWKYYGTWTWVSLCSPGRSRLLSPIPTRFYLIIQCHQRLQAASAICWSNHRLVECHHRLQYFHRWHQHHRHLVLHRRAVWNIHYNPEIRKVNNDFFFLNLD
jgi:hypothetical protein